MAVSKAAPSQPGMTQQIQRLTSADGPAHQVGCFHLDAIMSVGPPIV